MVYLLDAETNFNYFTTLMGKLAQGIPNVPEMIVIGIENTQRERDFGSDSDHFWQFVADELIPLVNIRSYLMLILHTTQVCGGEKTMENGCSKRIKERILNIGYSIYRIRGRRCATMDAVGIGRR